MHFDWNPSATLVNTNPEMVLLPSTTKTPFIFLADGGENHINLGNWMISTIITTYTPYALIVLTRFHQHLATKVGGNGSCSMHCTSDRPIQYYPYSPQIQCREFGLT
jgi:hypothetical protein